MHVELLKALYGTFHVDTCFVMSRYDPCMANKIVDGMPMMVAWHINNFKVLHRKLSCIRECAKLLNNEFGKETPISKSYGKKHEYVGMLMDYSTPGEVTISMADYTRLILQETLADMAGTAAMPASNWLFKVNTTNPNKLTGEKKDVFVHIVMPLLYLSQ